MASGNGQATGSRVWDRFLTDQDRAHVAASHRRPKGFGERPALLLIDLYRWVYGDEPQSLLEAIKKWPGSCGLPAWESIPHLQRLLAAARAASIPVIHTTGLDETEGIRPWARGLRITPEFSGDPEAEERSRRKYGIIDEVAPAPGELVIRKTSPSAFWGSPLVGHLIDHQVDTIIVGGESTSGCVRASVVDGCTYRFKMIVVEECVFDRHEATHAVELFTMHEKYAEVVRLDEALAYLEGIRAQRAVPAAAGEAAAARR